MHTHCCSADIKEVQDVDIPEAAPVATEPHQSGN